MQERPICSNQRRAEMPSCGNEDAIGEIGVHLEGQTRTGHGDLRRERGKGETGKSEGLMHPSHNVTVQVDALLAGEQSNLPWGNCADHNSIFVSSAVQDSGNFGSEAGVVFDHPKKCMCVEEQGG